MNSWVTSAAVLGNGVGCNSTSSGVRNGNLKGTQSELETDQDQVELPKMSHQFQSSKNTVFCLLCEQHAMGNGKVAHYGVRVELTT